jgi:hypothetical protein
VIVQKHVNKRPDGRRYSNGRVGFAAQMRSPFLEYPCRLRAEPDIDLVGRAGRMIAMPRGYKTRSAELSVNPLAQPRRNALAKSL